MNRDLFLVLMLGPLALAVARRALGLEPPGALVWLACYVAATLVVCWAMARRRKT